MKNHWSTRCTRLALIILLFLLVPVAAQPNDYTITLKPGWNFISTPKVLDSGNNTPVIFKDVNTSGRSIWQYDAQAQQWRAMNASTRVNMLDGIWIYSNTTMDVPFQFSQDPPGTPPAKQVYDGWNAIGSPDTASCSAYSALMSVDHTWTHMIGYNATTQGYEISIINRNTGIHSFSREMLPAQGYWLNITGNGVLAACGCADSDSDGFSDVSENQDYIDLNYNGVYDADVDFRFPHADFTLVNHNGTGTGVLGPAPINTGSPVEPADVKITIVSTGATNVATFNYSLNGSVPAGTLVTNRSIDLPGNVRLYFSDGSPEPSFVAGDTYTFSAGVNAKIADKDKPNIYVQYDYMGWAEPGATCGSTADCEAGQPNDVCHAGHCNHNHEPVNPTFQNVVDAFAAHNVTLYIDPVHNEIPHSKVITFSKPGDGTIGATAACAGANVIAGNIGPGVDAVSFYDVKNRLTYGGPFDPRRENVFRYAVFSHFNTCDTPDHCGACPEDRSSPPYTPQPVDFGSSGVAELPGNDFMITLSNLFFGTYPMPRSSLPLAEAGTFMHEMGHTLGLHHNGDIGMPAYSPNYISVMNYNYQFTGIMTSTVAGSSNPDGPTRLDYSNIALPVTLNEGSLNENRGVSDISSGNLDICTFLDGSGNGALGAGAGPIDWSGDGSLQSSVAVDLNGMNGATEQFRGYADWIHGTCNTSNDCPINNVRTGVAGGVPTREPCVKGRCQSLMYNFQVTPWGMAD